MNADESIQQYEEFRRQRKRELAALKYENRILKKLKDAGWPVRTITAEKFPEQ